MKTRKYHIICSWILLACFVSGQVMLYAHHHNAVKTTQNAIAKNTSGQTVAEKCSLCTAMHYNVMVTAASANFAVVALLGHIFKNFAYHFTSIQLVLSIGRAPPVVYSA